MQNQKRILTAKNAKSFSRGDAKRAEKKPFNHEKRKKTRKKKVPSSSHSRESGNPGTCSHKDENLAFLAIKTLENVRFGRAGFPLSRE